MRLAVQNNKTDMMALLACLWLSGSLFILITGQDCIYEGCTCYGNSVTCDGLGLQSIPPLAGSGVYNQVSLDYNSISKLPAGCFPANIQMLSIMSNPLTTIDDSVFDASVNTLQSVILSGANFTSIPAAFGRLKNLQYLYIYSTTIQSWNQDIMKNLSVALKSLALDGCYFQSWPDWMEYFTSLSELSLQDNAIAVIPDDGLEYVANTLTSLNLQNNSLTSVPKAISTLTALQNLYLQQNHIADVTWLPPNSKLTVLYINNNNIYDADKLSQALRPYADSLQQLSIISNRLSSIPKLDFLKILDNMDFTRNQLSDSLSGALPSNLISVSFSNNALRSIPQVLLSLKYNLILSLSSNSLTQIRDFEFPIWTTSASFGNNFITDLSDNSFPQKCSIQVLELNNNPLHKISDQAFQNVPNLQYLNLASTKLTRLPMGLLSGARLASVDFTDCRDLVCTCQEKVLASWITSLSIYAIVGDCGRTSVYEFYTYLVNDCPT